MLYKRAFVTVIVLCIVVALGATAFKLNLRSGDTLLGQRSASAVEETGHAHGPGAHHHAQADGQTAQITVWDNRLEIFLEHPFLVAGVGAEFVTHVSFLDTGQPRTVGPVIFSLTSDTGIQREYVVPAPVRPGIYLPQLIFPQDGQWDVTLRVPLEVGDHKVVLPAVTVFASQTQADAAPEPQVPEGINFLKEQQWPIRMKVQPVTVRSFGQRSALAVPQSAVFEDGGKQALYVQAAGETLQARFPELGVTDSGWIEVVSGVVEGEQVVSEPVKRVLAAIHESPDPGHDHGHDHGPEESDRLAKYDIETETIGPGTLSLHATLAGEVKLNADRMVHIVPQVSGRVRVVEKNVGDAVITGEPIAWLESAALGQAKIDYLSKLAEVSCCSIELTRAQQVHDSVTRLLESLESDPSPETFHDSNHGPMGKIRSDLISSYAEFRYAQTVYEREKRLFDGKISSADDFHKAQGTLQKTQSFYEATRDRVGYEIQHELLEARRAQRIREIEVIGAERTLYVLGLTQDEVAALQTLDSGHSDGGLEEHVCDDPNCTDCEASAHGQLAHSDRDNEHLSWYSLRAPLNGTVISKHLSLGESVEIGEDVFVVADLSTVWVDFRVHQKDLAIVAPGHPIVIEFGSKRVEGTISYLSPIVDSDTRTALARVVLPNPDGYFRPGTFVSGNVTSPPSDVALMIDKSALQYIDDHPCVFTYDGHAFEKRNVMLGRSDGQHVEITAGLQAGVDVVTKNAFRIKAESLKDTMAGGHGHVH